MSWKLAEMRWRDEIGLNERCRVKAGMYQKDDITMNTTEVQRAHRGRSYTSPWCREMLGGNRLEYPTNEKRRPDPMLLAPVEVLDSSTTPLLRRTKSATRTSIDRVLPAHINAQHMTETETALLQTPLRPVSFRATPNLRPYVEGVKTTSRLQEGGLVSSKVSRASYNLDWKDENNPVATRPLTPQRPFSVGHRSSTDAESPFDFEFARTPSFGLHFHQQSRIFEENYSVQRSGTDTQVLWTRSLSLSPALRRTSLESAHHSDSALLQNFNMENSTSPSSLDRRVTRPIYPDLPSAYARIQGRRTASLQPASSSRSGTRFPLSPSSSSSDEDAPASMYLGNDAVPLRNLPCRRVRSAQVILHQADEDHPESSAVFETSDDNAEPERRTRRTSTTLEEIVSQYADAEQISPQLQNDQHVQERLCNRSRSVLSRAQRTPANVDPFHSEATPSLNPFLGHSLHRPHQQSQSEKVLPFPGNLEGVSGDEEWETVQDSSRIGLFTPSKSRFRLRKRKTVDTASSHLTGRSPTSPWDPLSKLSERKISRLRPRSCHKTPATQHRKFSAGQHNNDTSRDKRPAHDLPLTLLNPGQMIEWNGRRRDRSDLAVTSPLHPSNRYQRPLPSYNIRISSQPSTVQSTTLSTSHALVSSSLFPKMLDNNLLSSHLSPTIMNTSNEIPQAVRGSSTFERLTRGMKDDDQNLEVSQNLGAGDAPVLAQRSTRPPDQAVDGHPTPAMSIDGGGNSAINSGPHVRDSQNTRDRTQNKQALMALRLQAQGYTLDDSEISRFLRDSRRLRHGTSVRQTMLTGHKYLNRQAVGVTGSSVADMSSDSDTPGRVRAAIRASSGSHYSVEDRAEIMGQPRHRATRFLDGSDNTTTANSFSDSVAGSVHATTSSAVQSLMPRRGQQAILVCNELSISVDVRIVQRKAGTLLLVFGMLAYLPGGWALIHSMGEGGPLATTAMAELTRVLVGREEGVVSCVHPTDAAMARAIERAAAVVLVLGAFAWLAVSCWAATTM